MKEGCIPMEYVNDGKLDCDGDNDETFIKSLDKMSCSSCSFAVIRLDNETLCIPPLCNISTCNNVPALQCSEYDCNITEAVCFSFCLDNNTSANCEKIFQCFDQSLILNQNFCNGNKDCKDGSDEIISQPGFKCSAKFSTTTCVLPQWNLYDDIPQCYDKSDLCFGSDGSFHCFKCLDNRLIISSKQVCDGVIDCFDFSDECLCENPSLPECLDVFSRSQRCSNFVSWDIKADVTSSNLCAGRECGNLLQINKVLTTCKNKKGNTLATQCDGRPECMDFVDECLSCDAPPAFCHDACYKYFPMGDRYCDGYADESWIYLLDTNCTQGFDEENCPKRFQCKAGEKVNIDIVQKCDGFKDCDEGIDEENCPKRFQCKAGEKVNIDILQRCDGFKDCDEGIDEENCPKRFQCKAGEDVSIDILQCCDGIEDCEEGIDEVNCLNRHYCTTKVTNLKSIAKSSVLNGKQDCVDGSDEFIPGIFSSARNMIDSFGLKIWLWFATILTLFGNFYVTVLSIAKLREKKKADESTCNHILITNLSISDCLMGVYLMIILVTDIQYSGRYSEFDYKWRSSALCSLAGSLCVISSQTSCFLISVLTSYRLYAVLYPFKVRTTLSAPWSMAAIFSWVTSIIIAFVSNITSYFKSKVLFLNEFSSSDTVTHDYVTGFACRLAILTNTSQDLDDSSWQSVKSFLNNKFPQYAPRGEIGYYGTTSVCMPRLYVNRSDSFWIYSIVMITFNFISFLFVLSGFTLIAWNMRKRPMQNNNAQKQNAKMNRRIARIIISDFLCWVPICIMAYVSVSGVKLPDGVEIFTAGVLLPINSAFNPILYSPYIEAKVKNLFKKIRPSRSQEIKLDVIS
ncbi:uncharacterized protein LOC143470664 [Clavelina lepadiformis]|uniref:uncharacterized protein LOC143470664 n=1 Tax=Clavelina lepadiformis TaxID=159417 RepID=UPI004042CD01